MREKIGDRLVRWRWWIVAAWLVLAAALAAVVRPVNPTTHELLTFLPADSPSVQAAAALERHFPHSSGLSQAVVVIERFGSTGVPPVKTEEETATGGTPVLPNATGQTPVPPTSAAETTATAPATSPAQAGLTQADLAALEGLVKSLRQKLPEELKRDLNVRTLSVRFFADFPAILKPNPMISADGQAAIAIIQVPANFITIRSARAVDHIRRLTSQTAWPAGLNVAVTGSAGFGRDYAAASEQSHRRTLIVTIVSVLVILLAIYRAPLAAAAVVGTISLAAVVAYLLLALATHLGLHLGTAERIFVFVLLYGAGVDYSLLYFSRFRELLPAEERCGQAAGRAWSLSAATIMASAGTVIAGLVMLSAARFKLFKTTGQAVALALVVALAAALTLMPAIAAIAHRRLFWPMRRPEGGIGAGRLWNAVGEALVRRPGLIFVATLALLAGPAWHSLRLDFSYDTVSGLGSRYPAVQGLEIVKRHWPAGQISPLVVLLEAQTPQAKELLPAVTDRATTAITRITDVGDVRSLAWPIGRVGANPLTRVMLSAAAAAIRAEYADEPGGASRLTVVLTQPAFSDAAMAALGQIRQEVGKLLPRGMTVQLVGATAEMADIRAVTQRDFYRVAALSLSAVFVIVLVLLRDLLLSAFMVASTVLSYLATLGVTSWFFTACLGVTGLDWKVEVFLFVVMVAVGQDYNIFLAARLAEESLIADVRTAARLAVARTGGVISSAGVIMAATLGSLAAGDLLLLVELGFAFALGMLVDTFLVRPLLLPTFAVLTGRTGRALTGRKRAG